MPATRVAKNNEQESINYYSENLNNLEYLEYQVSKIGEIYALKDQDQKIHRKLIRANNWKFLKNLCILLLYLGIFFSKPSWCDRKKGHIDVLCNYDPVNDQQYFTNQNVFMELQQIEIFSWIIMFLLIIQDIPMITVNGETKMREILSLTILYILDVIFGFLYTCNVLDKQFNHVFRLLFLIYHQFYTRVMFGSFLKFLWNIRKIIYLFFFIVFFMGMMLFVLYFDIQEGNDQVYYNRLRFDTVMNSIYSSYTIFTLENCLNLMNFTMKYHPTFLIFLIPLFYFVLFLFISFVMARICYSYSKTIRRNIRNIMRENRGVKRILLYFNDSKGLVDYQALNDFVDTFFKDPNQIDFKTYENSKREDAFNEKQERNKLRKETYNVRHYQSFMNIKRNSFYRFIYVAVDIAIAFLPILILNVVFFNLNEFWYFLVIVLCGLSCVDPFLSLNFTKHKISLLRRNLYQLKFLLSCLICILAMMIPMQPRINRFTVEQSNDLLFITFSVLCFFKLLTAVDELFLKNYILSSVFSITHHFYPLGLKVFTMIFLFTFFYSIVGSFLYGGLINSASILAYKTHTGIDIREKYEYFNFNTHVNGFMTLFVILLKNNWIYISEIMYQVRPGLLTTLFLASYSFLVRFICTALIMGMMSKVILLFFEKDCQVEQPMEEIKEENSDFLDVNNEREVLVK